MRYYFSIAAWVLMFSVPSIAMASDVEICNRTPYFIKFALVYRADGTTHREGWYPASPGDCTHAVTEHPISEEYYYFAAVDDQDPVARIAGRVDSHWAGDVLFCAPNEPFFASGQAVTCNAEETKPFVRQRSLTVDLVHADYPEASLEAAKKVRSDIIAGYVAGEVREDDAIVRTRSSENKLEKTSLYTSVVLPGDNSPYADKGIGGIRCLNNLFGLDCSGSSTGVRTQVLQQSNQEPHQTNNTGLGESNSSYTRSANNVETDIEEPEEFDPPSVPDIGRPPDNIGSRETLSNPTNEIGGFTTN